MNNGVVEDRAVYVRRTGKQPFYGFSRRMRRNILRHGLKNPSCPYQSLRVSDPYHKANGTQW